MADFIMMGIALLVHVAVCSFFGAKCQPLYRMSNSKCNLTPEEYEIKSIMRSCDSEEAANFAIIIKTLAVNDHAWWYSAQAFKSISKVPVGYVLTVINAEILIDSADFTRTVGVVVLLAVIAIDFAVICALRKAFYPYYNDGKKMYEEGVEYRHINPYAKGEEALEALSGVLNSEGPKVKFRTEAIVTMLDKTIEYHVAYLIITAVIVAINVVLV